jgi:hypothetical protein
MKIYRNLIIILSFFIITNNVLSQNEAFHGGVGDGFAYEKSSLINMEQVSFEGNSLTVTINQESSQSDPTNQDLIIFTAIFSENVTDFDHSDILVVGSIKPQNIIVTGSDSSYTIQVSSMINNGNVILQIPAGKVHNSVGNPNLNSTSIDNSVTYYGADLTVEINLAEGQKLYCNKQEIHFSVVFSENVIDFNRNSISLSGSALASIINISGSGAIYNVAISGMKNDGNVIINIPENNVYNNYGKGNTASNNIGNNIFVDYKPPKVEITQEIGQHDPAFSLPLRFHVEFDEQVEEFGAERVNFGGSEEVYIKVMGSGKSYTIEVFGVKTNETISISLLANITHDIAGNFNIASINTDNSITYKGITSVNNIDLNKTPSIYYSEGFINVNFTDTPDKKSSLVIYDIQGRLLYFKQNLAQLNFFPINQLISLYVIIVKIGNDKLNKILVITK